MEEQLRSLKILAAVGAVLALAFALWMSLGGGFRARSLPRFGPAPSFKLIGTDAKAFDSAQLSGKVWVASFIFSTCKNSCPMLGAQMLRLAEAMPEEPSFRLVSITVDPDRDTPARLKKYAADLGAGDQRWSFLTGKKDVLKRLINDGFKLAALPGEVVVDERGTIDILHSSKLVLVDGAGEIRGYYDGMLGESVEALARDIRRLLPLPRPRKDAGGSPSPLRGEG